MGAIDMAAAEQAIECSADFYWLMFCALQRRGFTVDQAMEIIKTTIMANGVKL